jgi:fluoroacetyl-CoA thioesterase
MTRGKTAKLEPGLLGFCERVVTQEMTLAQVDPRLPAVFSTPSMIGMMEMASSHAVRRALPEESITVGVRIEVDHLKAVAAGVTVIANARLVEVEGRRLIFEVEARSGSEIIGRGRIFHRIVDHARFAATAKGNSAAG